MSSPADLRAVVVESQCVMGSILAKALERGPLTVGDYQRFLSVQYHLTKGVQRYFLMAASHECFARRASLRNFLINFAQEEEQHYLIAKADLVELGLELLSEPFDVLLWHTYFRDVVVGKPFVRLGAACVLENVSSGEARPFVHAALRAPFLTRKNSRFLVLHQHEVDAHGDQIVEAVLGAGLTAAELRDLVIGARQGAILYLRMVQWSLSADPISMLADSHPQQGHVAGGLVCA